MVTETTKNVINFADYLDFMKSIDRVYDMMSERLETEEKHQPSSDPDELSACVYYDSTINRLKAYWSDSSTLKNIWRPGIKLIDFFTAMPPREAFKRTVLSCMN